MVSGGSSFLSFLSLLAKTRVTLDPTGERKQWFRREEHRCLPATVFTINVQQSSRFQNGKKKRLKMKTLTDEKENVCSVQLGVVAGFFRVSGV